MVYIHLIHRRAAFFEGGSHPRKKRRRVSKKKERKKEREGDEGMGELESQVESSYCRHLHGHRPRVPTEPAHAWWGRGEGKVGRFRDGGRWYCRVEFERTVLRMEIRRRVPSSMPRSLLSLALDDIQPPPHPLPRLDPTASGPSFRVVLCFSRFHPRRGHCASIYEAAHSLTKW